MINFGDDTQATVHYSIPKDAFGDRNIMKNDWCCYKVVFVWLSFEKINWLFCIEHQCGVNNFKRRDQCFKCGTPKEESLANETGDEVSLTPTNCKFVFL